MPFTEEQLEALNAVIAEQVTAALGGDALTKAVMKASRASSKAETAAALKGLDLDAKIAEAVKAAVSEPAVADAGGDAGGETGPDAPTPAMKRLEAQMAQMRKDNEAARAAVAAAEAKSQRTALHSAARDALTSAGADPTRLGVAMNHLGALGVLQHAEDGTPVFVSRSAEFGEERRTLADGLGDWLKTDEGKLFMPPVNVQGAGGVRATDGAVAPRAKDGSLDTGALRQGMDLAGALALTE